MNIEDVKKIWDKRRTRDMDFINKTIRKLNLNKESKILDIGTGWGMMSISLAINGFNVLTGEPWSWQDSHERPGEHHVHKSPKGHDDWKKTAEDLGVAHKIRYQQFDAESLPFPAKSFNAIFMYNTLHHVKDKKSALNECIRTLSPDGVICIIEMNQNGIEYIHRPAGFKHELIDPRDLINEDNFSVDSMEGQYADAFILRIK